MRFKAVQYDKNTGFTTWIDLFTKKTIEVSDEIKQLFNVTIPNISKKEQRNLWKTDGMDNFIKKMKFPSIYGCKYGNEYFCI